MSLKKKLHNLCCRCLGLKEVYKYGRVSYAQEGEDILLWRILDGNHSKNGVYVEVGCNHPWRYSNTAFYYKQGWSGVVIDPNPDFRPHYVRERPLDKFLNIGISDHEDIMTYHRFEESLLNTFCPQKAEEITSRGVRSANAPLKIKVLPLAQALKQVWPAGRDIDLLSIDAEGMDEQVLAGHDFYLYPVRFLIVEFEATTLSHKQESDIVVMLRDRGYLFVSKLLNSGIFIRHDEARRIGLLD